MMKETSPWRHQGVVVVKMQRPHAVSVMWHPNPWSPPAPYPHERGLLTCLHAVGSKTPYLGDLGAQGISFWSPFPAAVSLARAGIPPNLSRPLVRPAPRPHPGPGPGPPLNAMS